MSVGRHQLSSIPWWKRIPSIDDIEYEPIRWLIEPLIPLAGFVLLVGKPGSYKSWLALDVARAVATGTSFADMTPSPAREVLYIDRENGKNLIAYRKKLLRISGVPDLRYWGRWVSLPFLGVASKELLQYAEEVKPLLIFDSLVRVHQLDENSNSEMARVMNAFVQLSRKGATVLLLHHAGKDNEKNFRGAMEIEAAPDIAYRVDRKDRVIKLRQFKNRFAEEQSLELHWTEYGFQSPHGGSEVAGGS